VLIATSDSRTDGSATTLRSTGKFSTSVPAKPLLFVKGAVLWMVMLPT
jgi:hypothetical protein